MVDNCSVTKDFSLFKRLLASAAVLSALTLSATGAEAITTTYVGNLGGAEETAFLSAAGGGLTFEGFEGLTPGNFPFATLVQPLFTLDDTGTGSFQNDLRICAPGLCSNFSSPTEGSNYMHTSGQVTFTFNTAVNAVSFTASGFGVFPTIELTTNAGDLANIVVPNFGLAEQNFVGIINDTATFTELTLRYGRDDDSIGIDELRFGTLSASIVPEPGMMAIFGLGLAGLAITRRRKGNPLHSL